MLFVKPRNFPRISHRAVRFIFRRRLRVCDKMTLRLTHHDRCDCALCIASMRQECRERREQVVSPGPTSPLEVHVHIHLHNNDLALTLPGNGVGSSGMAPTLKLASPPERTLEAGDKLISDALEAWRSDMRRRHKSEVSIKRMGTHIEMCCNHCAWSGVRHLQREGLCDWLALMVSERKWSGATHDVALAALRVFGRFCYENGWIERHPFAGVAPSAEPSREAAGALTVEQARAIIAVALAASGKNRRARSNRALFYGTMILAGLRVTETSRLRWRDLDIDSAEPSITTDPSWAKNRRELRVALAPELAEQLRRERNRNRPESTDFVFPVVPNRATWRLDREAAGVPATTAQGRALSPHCCRKTLATWLYSARLPDGTPISPAVVKAIMRHDQGEAHARYSDLWSSQVDAVATLPLIFPNQSGNGVDLPTKIDDTPPTTAAIPSDTKPAIDPPSSRGKPLSGFLAGLALEETPAKRPGGRKASRAESDRLCPFPEDETRNDLIRVLKASGTMMLATARLLAKASEAERASVHQPPP